MARRKKAAAKEDAGRWMVSYADLLTLLFALFVVLYGFAMSAQSEVKSIVQGLVQSFTDMGFVTAHNGNVVMTSGYGVDGKEAPNNSTEAVMNLVNAPVQGAGGVIDTGGSASGSSSQQGDQQSQGVNDSADVVESNGSSSQASICANCMSLMAAGVPIKGIVSGIAMGLITSGPLDGKHPYTILTDIQGLEDHFGDMDFKCAGTAKGLTALQMDIKIHGVTREVLSEALAQANRARAEIRAKIAECIPEPRKEVSKYAPKMITFKIPTDKIRDVIGKGGETIQGMVRECGGAAIDVEDDGTITIYHSDRAMIEKAKAMIDEITREARVGEIFEGKVTRVEDYGAFVNLFGDTDGLCHVSRLKWDYVDNASSIVKVGDSLKVVVIGLDEKGKVKVSHREFEEKPEGYVERPERESRPKGHNGFQGKGNRDSHGPRGNSNGPRGPKKDR